MRLRDRIAVLTAGKGKWVIRAASTAACVCMLVLLGFYLGLRFNYPSRSVYPIHGLDVSHHQGAIDWARVPKNKFTFVIIKATEGSDWVDPKFMTNWSQAKAAGLKVGAYHFFSLCKSGLDQARNFAGIVPLEPGMVTPVVDLEFLGNCPARPDAAAVHAEIEHFVNLLATVYGKRPILYTTYEFAALYLPDAFLRSERVWIRDVFRTPRAAFGEIWTLWQYANNGRVPGIKGRVDLNVFRGDAKAFKALLIEPERQFAGAEQVISARR